MQEVLRDLKVTTVAPPTPRRLSAALRRSESCTKRVINGVEGVNIQVPTLALSVAPQKASEDAAHECGVTSTSGSHSRSTGQQAEAEAPTGDTTPTPADIVPSTGTGTHRPVSDGVW